MRERFLSAATSRHDDVAVAEDSSHKALVDGDGFNLVKHKLDGTGIEHANFHHDALVGNSEVGTLSFDERGQQDKQAEGNRYPGEVTPSSLGQQPGNWQ